MFCHLLIPVRELNEFVAVATMQISFHAFTLVVEDTRNRSGYDVKAKKEHYQLLPVIQTSISRKKQLHLYLICKFFSPHMYTCAFVMHKNFFIQMYLWCQSPICDIFKLSPPILLLLKKAKRHRRSYIPILPHATDIVLLQFFMHLETT